MNNGLECSKQGYKTLQNNNGRKLSVIVHEADKKVESSFININNIVFMNGSKVSSLDGRKINNEAESYTL